MEELVSIITPSYNTARFIGETIQSVINQTYQNWEMLIVDDCSKDNTKEIVESFKDKRIKFFSNEKNSGAAISRNTALRKAKGKWIAFLDSDDLWEPTKLEEQIGFMKNNGYDFSYTKYSQVNEETKPLGKTITGPKRISKSRMFCYCYPGCLTVMYNAEKIGLIQIPDLKKRNDDAMWLKVVKKSPCYLLEKDLAKYRIRSGSISNVKKTSLIKYQYDVFRKSEGFGKIKSFLFTIRVLFFGVLKRFIYEKRA